MGPPPRDPLPPRRAGAQCERARKTVQSIGAVKRQRRPFRSSGGRAALRAVRTILRGLAEHIDELERDSIALVRRGAGLRKNP